MKSIKVSGLFRKEVFIFRQNDYFGAILSIKYIPMTVFTIGFVLLALFVFGYFVWGEYTRKIRVNGYIVPVSGVIKIIPAQSGIVTRLLVKENQLVQKGDVLAVLNSERTIVGGGASAEVEKQLSLRRASLQQEQLKIKELYAQQKIALDARLNNMRTELMQMDSSLILQQKRTALTEKIFENQRKLFIDKFLSEMALQQKEQDWMSDLSVLESMQRNKTILLRDINATEAEKMALPLKLTNEIAGLQRNLASLIQDGIENETRRELLIKAPQSGVVTAVVTDMGKLAVAGQPIFNLIPEKSVLQVDIYLPARAAGFVKLGSKALLQFQAFPYQKFGSYEAKVIKMSRVAIVGNELPYPPPVNNGPGDLFYIASLALYKNTVTAYGKEEPLQPGMGVDANVILDTRTLLEWVFEPVYSVSGNWVHL